MKLILFYLLFLFIPKLCISQVITEKDDAVYLDSLYNMGNEKNYKYIRVIKDYKALNKKSYEVKDFYKSGKIAMSGTTTTTIDITKTGQFIYFYENGNRKIIANYKQDKPFGVYYEFHENGNKKLEGEWVDNDKTVIPNLNIKNYWDSNTNQTIKDGNGYYEEIYNNNELKGFSKGKIKNNLKDSIWIGIYKTPKFTFIENYENGKFVSGASIDSNKVEHKYNDIKIHSIPKKGMNDFYNHIARTFKTPKEEGLKGKIYVTFIVETDGSINEVKVLRDLGYGTGKEAIKAILSYKDWLPGEQRGIKVRARFSLPINIETSR